MEPIQPFEAGFLFFPEKLKSAFFVISGFWTQRAKLVLLQFGSHFSSDKNTALTHVNDAFYGKGEALLIFLKNQLSAFSSLQILGRKLHDFIIPSDLASSAPIMSASHSSVHLPFHYLPKRVSRCVPAISWDNPQIHLCVQTSQIAVAILIWTPWQAHIRHRAW